MTEESYQKWQAAETAKLDAILSAIAEGKQGSTKYLQQEEASMQGNTKAEWWLVGAAIVQTIALIGTLFAIWYQGVKTRDAAEATQETVTAIKEQTEYIKTSAKAAEDNIELIIKKERARVVVDLKDLNLPSQAGNTIYSVEFLITAHGTTAAYIEESKCAAYFSPLEHIEYPDMSSTVMFPIYGLKKVLSPNEPIEASAFLTLEDEVLNEIRLNRLAVGVRGCIKYKDVFDRSRETSFRYVWKPFLYGGGNWERGRAEENQAT